MQFETDTERCGSHQWIGSKEHQIRPFRAVPFEFHVPDKRGFSAASLLPTRLYVAATSKGTAPKWPVQFHVLHTTAVRLNGRLGVKHRPCNHPQASRGNCKRGIPVVVLASGETNRMINESLGQAALGLGQQDRHQMEQVSSLGYSPLGKLCLK